MSETFTCPRCGVRIYLPRGSAFRPSCLGISHNLKTNAPDEHEAVEMELVEP